jgi:hypothetical protein
MPLHRCTPAACLWLLASCQVTELESAAGRHVVVHWDPDEYQLCGGTIAHIDSLLEIEAQTYGVDLPAVPNTDIYWTTDHTLVANACWVAAAGACNLPLPNGTNILITPEVVSLHELTHTVNLTGAGLGLPSLFAEGVATRWEAGLGTWAQTDKTFYRGDLTYSQIIAWLEQVEIPPEAYGRAGFLWSWLEAEFGPRAMKVFASRINMLSSVAKIEREFEATFGITLETAVDMSRGQPLMVFDVHACSMTHLPTLVWAEAPLVLSTGPSTCAAADVVNEMGGARYARLELGDVWRQYSLEVTGPLFSGASIHFFECRGEPIPYRDPMAFASKGSDWSVWLGGTYIVIVTAAHEKDGTIPFPTVELKPP